MKEDAKRLFEEKMGDKILDLKTFEVMIIVAKKQ